MNSIVTSSTDRQNVVISLTVLSASISIFPWYEIQILGLVGGRGRWGERDRERERFPDISLLAVWTVRRHAADCFDTPLRNSGGRWTAHEICRPWLNLWYFHKGHQVWTPAGRRTWQTDAERKNPDVGSGCFPRWSHSTCDWPQELICVLFNTKLTSRFASEAQQLAVVRKNKFRV